MSRPGDGAETNLRIRQSVEADVPAIAAIINDAAQAYRGVIPADRWHEPYMPTDELAKEIHPGKTGRDVGRPRRWTMAGGEGRVPRKADRPR